MKRLLLSLSLAFPALSGFGQERAASGADWKAIAAFIPSGFDTLDGGLVRGDLTKDGMPDVVLALHNSAAEEQDGETDRLLIVLQKTASGYKVAGKSSGVLMCKSCGGVFGDPWNGLSIAKGVLTVSHYGGSAWRWSDDEKFRYQGDGLYLIGSTYDSYLNTSDCDGEGVGDAGREFRDTNWVTGDEEYLKRNEECKLVAHSKKKIKRKPLQKLEQYKGA